MLGLSLLHFGNSQFASPSHVLYAALLTNYAWQTWVLFHRQMSVHPLFGEHVRMYHQWVHIRIASSPGHSPPPPLPEEWPGMRLDNGICNHTGRLTEWVTKLSLALVMALVVSSKQIGMSVLHGLSLSAASTFTRWPSVVKMYSDACLLTTLSVSKS